MCVRFSVSDVSDFGGIQNGDIHNNYNMSLNNIIPDKIMVPVGLVTNLAYKI